MQLEPLVAMQKNNYKMNLCLCLKVVWNSVFGIETGPWVVLYVRGIMLPVLIGARGSAILQNVQAGSRTQAHTLKGAAELRPYKSKF